MEVDKFTKEDQDVVDLLNTLSAKITTGLEIMQVQSLMFSDLETILRTLATKLQSLKLYFVLISQNSM